MQNLLSNMQRVCRTCPSRLVRKKKDNKLLNKANLEFPSVLSFLQDGLGKSKGLADFGKILISICENLETRRICSRCYGNQIIANFVANHQTRLRVSQLETSFGQDKSESCRFEELVFDWEMFSIFAKSTVFIIW